ncbi:MAG: cytochrome c biogenesis heme-transporting ATPase CcmA [Burkholderiaceae bacterium]
MPEPALMSTPRSPGSDDGDAGVATLVLDDLGCRRGNRLLFRGVSFDVAPGQARWLRGRNGCGKTSLLRLAAGLGGPASGRVLYGGIPVRRAAGVARRITYVGHANALKEDLTVTEALQFLARLQGRDAAPASVLRALDRIGLSNRRDAAVRTLSQGQRRRASLARLAFETGASLWILDEPYDSLDAEGIERVDALLTEHLGRGGSVLLTSHQPPGSNAPAMVSFDLGAAA